MHVCVCVCVFCSGLSSTSISMEVSSIFFLSTYFLSCFTTKTTFVSVGELLYMCFFIMCSISPPSKSIWIEGHVTCQVAYHFLNFHSCLQTISSLTQLASLYMKAVYPE